jgi:excisionase family DNA binding protein
MKRLLNPVDASAEIGDDFRERRDQVRSPYLTAREAIEYLRLPSEDALYRCIREGLPHCRLGRLYRFDMRELDSYLKGFTSPLEMARATTRSTRKRTA